MKFEINKFLCVWVKEFMHIIIMLKHKWLWKVVEIKGNIIPSRYMAEFKKKTKNRHSAAHFFIFNHFFLLLFYAYKESRYALILKIILFSYCVSFNCMWKCTHLSRCLYLIPKRIDGNAAITLRKCAPGLTPFLYRLCNKIPCWYSSCL